MSHQGFEGWFPECLICGAGNVGAVVCLDPTCHEAWEVERLSRDAPKAMTGEAALDPELKQENGHWWKHCKLCHRGLLSDPGSFGSYAICLRCFNTYMKASALPPTTPGQVHQELASGHLRREHLGISVRKRQAG